MAKKISDKERAIQFCLNEPIEVVRELLTTCKQGRQPRKSGEATRTATAGQSPQGE